MTSKSAKKALEGTLSREAVGGSPVDRGKPSGAFLWKEGISNARTDQSFHTKKMAILAQCPYCRSKQSIKNKRCPKCECDMDKAKDGKKVKYYLQWWTEERKSKTKLIGTKISEARDAEGKRRVKVREEGFLDVKPDTKMKFQELTDWYLDQEKVKALRYYETLEINLQSFNKEFGSVIVRKIQPMDLENYQAKRKKQGYADSYIDQEVGAAKTVINNAFLNGKASEYTFKNFKAVKKLLQKGANTRDRVLSKTEFERLIDKAADHLKPILMTAYWTGMRKGEILPLVWSKVDLKARFIHLDPQDTKEGKAKDVPIPSPLVEVLRTLPTRLRNSYVFTYKGQPIEDIRTALTKACEDAKILYGRDVKGGFVFHDLRHTCKTNLRKAGVAQSVRMKIQGHSTAEMDNRYDAVDLEDKLQAIDQLEGYLQDVDHFVDQKQKDKQGKSQETSKKGLLKDELSKALWLKC